MVNLLLCALWFNCSGHKKCGYQCCCRCSLIPANRVNFQVEAMDNLTIATDNFLINSTAFVLSSFDMHSMNFPFWMNDVHISMEDVMKLICNQVPIISMALIGLVEPIASFVEFSMKFWSQSPLNSPAHQHNPLNWVYSLNVGWK